jgi:hypothetical protein
MITRDTTAFFNYARRLPFNQSQSCAKGFFLVSPVGFRLAEQSARDNHYMQMAGRVDANAALAEHAAIQAVLRTVAPVLCFPGDSETPDAVFTNNVFAVTPEHVIVGHMRHPVRQREATRYDIRRCFTDLMGRTEIDLSQQPGIAELTGSLIIDRSRAIGFCGLSERCDEIGARAMADAFALRAMLLFDLADGEYHTNVVLSVLAGRAAVVAPCGFADPSVAEAISAFYAPHVVPLSTLQKAEFAGNCLAIGNQAVLFSARAFASLDAGQTRLLDEAGFTIHSVAMPCLELAGGSVRCCIGEIY